MRFATLVLVLVLVTLSLSWVVGQKSYANANQVTILSHVFAKGIDKSVGPWRPINITNTFLQDEVVYAFTAALFLDSTNFTWVWYNPANAAVQRESATFRCFANSTSYCTFCDSFDYWFQYEHWPGVWRMELYADGVLQYSDEFTIIRGGTVAYEYSWTFDVKTRAEGPSNVNMTIALATHEEWEFFQFLFPSGVHVANFRAYEYGTMKMLNVTTFAEESVVGVHLTSNSTTPVVKSRTGVRVTFDSPKGFGYKFLLSFDDNDPPVHNKASPRLLRYSWSWGGIHPIPHNVTVILPVGYDIVRVDGDTHNYTRWMEEGRVVISFSGVSPPYYGFGWTVVFTEMSSVQSTTTNQQTTTYTFSPVSYLAFAVVALAILLTFLASYFRSVRRRGSFGPVNNRV